MTDRVHPVGPPRVTGDEHQVIILQRGRVPLQIVFRMDRLAVLVHAEEADIQVEAGILEVVAIAAERGAALLRRENQPHVVVFFVLVEVIQPAAVERDHFALQPGLVVGGLRLDGVHHGQAELLGLGRILGVLDRRFDPLGHVVDVQQHVEFQVEAFQLLLGRAGIVAQLHQVAVLRAELLQAPRPT